MEASQLTPSQARFIREHQERRARIAARAKPDTPVICLSASARARAFEPPVIELKASEVVPAETVAEWADRQIQRYKPFWFSIVDEIDPPPPPRPSVGLIQRICAKYYELSLTVMLSDRRGAELVKARQIAMYLAKEFTLKSLPEIGRRFGGRDHTTVIHALRKIKEKESTIKQMADDLNALRQQIREAC